MQQIQKLFEFIAFSSEAKQQQQEQEKLAGSGHTNTSTHTHSDTDTHTYILWLTHIQRGWVVMTQNIEQKKPTQNNNKILYIRS